jgi:cytochrome c oxidase accessory protein FixG
MATKKGEKMDNTAEYRIKRYYMYAVVTIISLALPFITIDGNHFFLLNFDHKQLHLFFTRFDMQELYMMPFLLIILFVGIFALTTVGGKVWCGWACPQTIFRVIYRDLIETKLLGLRRSIKNKQKEPKDDALKKITALVLWSVLALIAAADFMWYFVPPEDFFTYIQNPSDHPVLMGFLLGLAGFLVYDIISMKEDFCVYICPYSRVQSVMYDEETVQVLYDEKRGGQIWDHETKLWSKPETEGSECTGCESCVTICPTHIDIRKGTQLECINCLECIDACDKVMGKLGKPSLIEWTSPNALNEKRKPIFVRQKTIGYAVMLTLALFMLFYMGSEKEHMLLNINRTTQLYSIKENGNRVTNNYTMLFQNTESKDHEYYFEVVGHPDITINRPKKSFKILANKKAKKIVVLSTKKELVKDDRKDTPIPITIRAYATDDKEKIVVERKTTFIYPRYDILQQHKNK